MTSAAPPIERATSAPRRRRAGASQTASAVVALVVLVVANALFTPNFATTGNLWNVLLQTSTVALLEAPVAV